MQVKDFQKKVTQFVLQWDKKRKVVSNEQLAFTHLVEEVGELATQYVNRESRKKEYKDREADNAIADILMQLVRLAHLRNLDIEKAVLKIIKEEQKLLR